MRHLSSTHTHTLTLTHAHPKKKKLTKDQFLVVALMMRGLGRGFVWGVSIYHREKKERNCMEYFGENSLEFFFWKMEPKF